MVKLRKGFDSVNDQLFSTTEEFAGRKFSVLDIGIKPFPRVKDTISIIKVLRLNNGLPVIRYPTLRTARVGGRERVVWVWFEERTFNGRKQRFIRKKLANPLLSDASITRKIFNQQYNEMVNKNKKKLMVRKIPGELGKAMGELSMAPFEYGGALDYEYLIKDPHRIITYTGNAGTINLSKLNDFELDFHTHPQGKHNLEWIPSTNDLLAVTIFKPSIIIYLDRVSHRKRYLLLTSRKKYPTRGDLKTLEKGIKKVIRHHMNIANGSFNKLIMDRKLRASLFHDWRVIANSVGYDFKHINLKTAHIIMKADRKLEKFGRQEIPESSRITKKAEERILKKVITKTRKVKKRKGKKRE